VEAMGSMMSTTGISESFLDEVNASPETIWSVITDVENMPRFLSAVEEVKVLPSHCSLDEERKSELDRSPETATTCQSTHIDSLASSKTSNDSIYSLVSSKTSNDSIDTQSTCPFDESKGTVKEGFTWEETRYTFGRHSKTIKCVTSIGSMSSDVSTSSDNDSLPGRCIRRHQIHLRMNIIVHGTSKARKIPCHKAGTCTGTFLIGWDEVAANHGTEDIVNGSTYNDCGNSSVGTTTSYVVPKKCQLTVTMAFIPKSAIARWSLSVAGYCGLNYRINRIIQHEFNEIVLEAELRESSLSPKAVLVETST
jgi:Polyketide cyclase / dehydrase and lipid transport